MRLSVMYYALNRINRIEGVFLTLIMSFLADTGLPPDLIPSQVGDSVSIITYSHKRAAKVAPDLLNNCFIEWDVKALDESERS
jgi:hypothetical protein